MIGIVKSALKKVVGHALITLEELSSLLVEVESAVNDRPLTFVPEEFE